MFTGLVLGTGELVLREKLETGERIGIKHPLGELELGESIAVSGACLTVTGEEVNGSERVFFADVSPETFARTTLGDLGIGARVNLERSLRASDRLGGHIVTGHVDAVGSVESVRDLGAEMTELKIRLPKELGPLVAEKGSLAVAGVSLTVNSVADDKDGTVAGFLIIPHTKSITTLGELSAGSRVNLEADLLARYVARLALARSDKS
jgi:riboflavin synthase